MEDLKNMMETISLQACKDEIDAQFRSIESHDNEMKKALLLSFFLHDTLKSLNGVDYGRFIKEIRDELTALVNNADEWTLRKNMIAEHLEKNRDVFAAFEHVGSEIESITFQIQRLLNDYDSILKRLAVERCRKSIAEIEAERTNNT